MKVFEAQQSYYLLSQAKLDGLTTDEKYKVLSVARSFKALAKDFEDFIKDTQEGEVKDKNEQNKIISAEAERVIEKSSAVLEATVFDKLLEANAWNVAQVMLLEDCIKQNA